MIKLVASGPNRSWEKCFRDKSGFRLFILKLKTNEKHNSFNVCEWGTVTTIRSMAVAWLSIATTAELFPSNLAQLPRMTHWVPIHAGRHYIQMNIWFLVLGVWFSATSLSHNMDEYWWRDREKLFESQININTFFKRPATNHQRYPESKENLIDFYQLWKVWHSSHSQIIN